MAVACLALLIALGGTSVAAVTAIPRNSVGTPQLRAQAVTGAKAKNGTLATADVGDGTLTVPPAARRPVTPVRNGLLGHQLPLNTKVPLQ